MLRIDYGEEIMENLLAVCEKEGILLGQVSAIGAADHAAIGVYDLQTQSYHREDLDGFMEISSLAGSVTAMNGKPYLHLHANFGRRDYTVIGGHLLSCVLNGACELVVKRFHCELGRRFEPSLGLNLYDF